MKGKTRTGEKARGLLCTQGKWGFSVPSPPMSRRWQGQQQRFKKDTQYFSLSLFLSLSFQTHRHTHSLIYKGAEGQAFSNTHSRNPIISSATSLFPGSTMSPSSVILFAELQHCAPSTNFFWLDLLAILVTVHHRLSRKPEFSTQNISSPPPHPLRNPHLEMGDLELQQILLLIISTHILPHIQLLYSQLLWQTDLRYFCCVQFIIMHQGYTFPWPAQPSLILTNWAFIWVPFQAWSWLGI